MVKMFHARRNPELVQRKQVNDTSATIADVMVKYLEVNGFGGSLSMTGRGLT